MLSLTYFIVAVYFRAVIDEKIIREDPTYSEPMKGLQKYTKVKRVTCLSYPLHMMNLRSLFKNMVYERRTAYTSAGSCQKGVD